MTSKINDKYTDSAMRIVADRLRARLSSTGLSAHWSRLTFSLECDAAKGKKPWDNMTLTILFDSRTFTKRVTGVQQVVETLRRFDEDSSKPLIDLA